MEHHFGKFISTKLQTFDYSIKEVKGRVREREEGVDHNSEILTWVINWWWCQNWDSNMRGIKNQKYTLGPENIDTEKGEWFFDISYKSNSSVHKNFQLT